MDQSLVRALGAWWMSSRNKSIRYMVQAVDPGDIPEAPRPGWCREDGVGAGDGAPVPAPKGGAGQRHTEAQGPAAPPGCPLLIRVKSQGRPRPPSSETAAARSLATWKEA